MRERIEIEIWSQDDDSRVLKKPYWWHNIEKQEGAESIGDQQMGQYLKPYGGFIRQRIRKGKLYTYIVFRSVEQYVEFMMRWV